jgi:hypothetical protein
MSKGRSRGRTGTARAAGTVAAGELQGFDHLAETAHSRGQPALRFGHHWLQRQGGQVQRQGLKDAARDGPTPGTWRCLACATGGTVTRGAPQAAFRFIIRPIDTWLMDREKQLVTFHKPHQLVHQT